jgi:hypothetical protein
VVAGLAAASAVLWVLTAVLVPGVTHRYETDFATYALLAALLTWFALRARTHGRVRRLVAVLGSVAVAWACVVGIALSVNGADARLLRQHPGTFAALDRFFSPLPTFVTQLTGRPVLAGADRMLLTGTPFVSPVHTTELTIVAPSRRTATLEATLVRGPAIPAAVAVMVRVRGADGVAATAPADGSAHLLSVRLDRGINRLPVELVAQRPYFALTAPQSLAGVKLERLRLR